MRAFVAAGLVLAAFVLSPTAIAAPHCVEGIDAPFYATRSGTSATIWSESNGVPGLQEAPCVDASGRLAPADTKVQTAGVPDLTGICTPPSLGRICLL